MHFRFRTLTVGDHTHIRVFVGDRQDLTHANTGQLTMRNNEWEVFKDLICSGDNERPFSITEFVNDEVG